MSNVKKAVFPVAGLGTRFLPATKASPKEMLPLVDKPLIQYAVEEVIAAGVTELIFITSGSKRAIEDHFDSNFELETRLKQTNKLNLLSMIENILPSHVSCVYIRQKQALGLGHAVLCAQPAVGDEPFFVCLADDYMTNHGTSCAQQLLKVYQQNYGSVIAVEKIKESDTEKYGVIAPGAQENKVVEITDIIEKPKLDKAPSLLGVAGRYLFTPEIFKSLLKTKPGVLGEIQLTDAIQDLLKKEKAYGLVFDGKRYDCGNKFGYLKATLQVALQHPEVAEELKKYLLELKVDA